VYDDKNFMNAKTVCHEAMDLVNMTTLLHLGHKIHCCHFVFTNAAECVVFLWGPGPHMAVEDLRTSDQKFVLPISAKPLQIAGQ